MSSRNRPAALAIVAALGLAIAAFAPSVRATVVTAVAGTPTVDGHLGDAAWRAAPWTDEFLQRSPQTGAAATHRTRARVLYDAQNLYIAIECATSTRPAARLSRRDVMPVGEFVRVMIDARGEGVSAFAFITNPAGVQVDAIAQGDDDFDTAWDAVWDAEPAITDHGWTVEYSIPWSALRFDAAHPTLRIQFERSDFGEGQTVALVPVPIEAPRYVANFARLAGVERIRPRRVLELRPYVIDRFRLAANPDFLDPTAPFSQSVGLDFKLGLTNDLVLDATLNPDFGQVEVDPSIVNLSTYEPFFSERRPFFLEGTDLFRTPIRILHTRRIGAAPGAPDPVHGGSITAVDPSAAIWGAAKLAGRIGSLSFLLLDGVTAPARAVETYSGNRQDSLLASPPTNWLAARVRAPFGAGSTMGALFTHVGRFDPSAQNDTVGSIDWDLRAPDGIHRFRGQLAASQAWNRTTGPHSGTALFLEFARAEHPSWIWVLRSRVYSRDFDPNGLGYIDRPNLVGLTFDITFRTPRPVGAFRSLYANPWVWRTTNTDNLVIDQGAGLELGAVGRNMWSLGVGARVTTAYDDDRETRGSIPWHNPPSAGAWAWISSDPRPSVRGGLYADVASQQGGHRGGATAWLAWIPVPFITINLTVSGRTVANIPRWVDNVTDPTSLLHPIFGTQRAQIADTTLRISASVTRHLSFDLYGQLLAAALRYEQFSELVAPDRLVPTVYTGRPDYDRVALTINAIARWEYLPGSYVTLVLLHRSATSAGPADGGYDTGLGLLGLTRPDTMLMSKLTCLWM